MPLTFDFLSPNDKPALIGITTPETQLHAMAVLEELGYKVHAVESHALFLTRFSQVSYPLVLIEELFAALEPSENQSLLTLQSMSMPQRRHATVFLIGDLFKTLDRMQAFHQSVHAVINRADLDSLGQIILKSVADNDQFLQSFREAQLRITQGA